MIEKHGFEPEFDPTRERTYESAETFLINELARFLRDIGRIQQLRQIQRMFLRENYQGVIENINKSGINTPEFYKQQSIHGKSVVREIGATQWTLFEHLLNELSTMEEGHGRSTSFRAVRRVANQKEEIQGYEHGPDATSDLVEIMRKKKNAN